MNKSIKEKWVAALRSGEYRQCKRRLRSGGAFCCLGVLDEVMDGTARANGHVLRCSFLDADTQAALFRMNDTGTPFSEIADWIEKHV